MFELIYRSVDKKGLSAEDILNILEKSREFNSKNDITGCLLYHDNEFIQILEGNKNLIRILFSKIEKDNRHTHVMLLAENEKEERTFKHWSMAFHELNNNDLDNLNKLLYRPEIT